MLVEWKMATVLVDEARLSRKIEFNISTWGESEINNPPPTPSPSGEIAVLSLNSLESINTDSIDKRNKAPPYEFEWVEDAEL